MSDDENDEENRRLQQYTEAFGRQVAEMQDRLSIPLDQRQNLVRRAARSYRRAKIASERLQEYSSRSESIEMEEIDDENDEEEQEESGESPGDCTRILLICSEDGKKMSPRRMMTSWRRLLEEVL